MIEVPFNDLRPALAPLRDEINQAIARVLDSGWFLRGPEVEAFEQEWAAFCGQRYCVACMSGTDALTIAAGAMDIDEVRVPANTLPLTAQGLWRGGAEVLITDVTDDGRLPDTRDGDEWPPSVPVLLYGRTPSDAELNSSLFDAAHAHGWKPPTHATACWSFYPTKNLAALGDAGAVTTNDESLVRKLRELSGQDDGFRRELQINSRIDEIQAAILRVRLKHLSATNLARHRVAEQYFGLLGEPKSFAYVTPPNGINHLFVIRCERRMELRAFLAARCIQTKVHFEQPLHDYRWAAWGQVHPCGNARRWCESVLSLPAYPGIPDEHVNAVVDALISWEKFHG